MSFSFPSLRREIVLGFVVLLSLASAGATTPAHPLHTTLTELSYTPANGVVQVSIRVFTDDFGEAVARRPQPRAASGKAPPNPALAYLGASFGIVGRNGKRVPLQWCGEKKTGDVLWICLRGSAPAGLRGGSVTNTLMFDLFEDQINIVQATYDGRKQSLLFTRGDGAKRLR